MSGANLDVAAVRLDGRPLMCGYIRHEEITAAGTLEFDLAPQSSWSWATALAARPYSLSAGKRR